MLLLAAAVFAATPVSIGVSGLRGVGLPENEASFYGELLGQRLRARGAKVVTPRELAELLGAERQKQLLGCSESCVAEIVQAMGTDLLLFGDVAHVGTKYTLSLSILASGRVKPVAQYAAQVADSDAMPVELDRAARELLVQAYATLGRTDLDAGPPPSRGYSRAWAAAPAALAVASGIVGAVFLADAQSRLRQVQLAMHPDEALIARNAGIASQTLGWVGVGVAAAALAAAVAVFALGGDRDLQASVAVTGSGGGFFLSGRFP